MLFAPACNCFPSEPKWIDGFLAWLWENGDVEFYADGDIRIPLSVLKAFVRAADKFMYERERRTLSSN